MWKLPKFAYLINSEKVDRRIAVTRHTININVIWEDTAPRRGGFEKFFFVIKIGNIYKLNF